jgi:Carboxypeptidase regulatory-like domain
MRAHARTVALVATVLLAATGLSTAVTAQKTPTPQASQSRRPAGSGSIAGAVASDADKPLTRARVVIRSAALAQARVALTDSKGIFRFEALPAGDYEVAASRTGLVLPNAAGGPMRGMQVRLDEGVLAPGASLAGRLDWTPKPAALGRYRLTGLPVGNYRIAAVDGMDELVARRQEWLARLSADGTAVTIASEGVRTLDLTALQGATLAPVAH